MKLKIFSNNIADINSYLLYKQNIGIIIDPGFNGIQITEFCIHKSIKIKYILLTHGHFDHIKDINLFLQNDDVNIYISKNDKDFLYNDSYNLSKFFGEKFILKNAKVIEVNNLEKLNLENEVFKIIYTPGHTKGSICIEYKNYLFTGDTLFYDSIGRTDLYSGNFKDIKKSLELLIKTTSNEKIIYPGHGKHAKMKEVKSDNKYLII